MKRLEDMLPSSTPENVADSTPANIILVRQFLRGNAGAVIFNANEYHLLFRQLGRANSAAVWLAAFGYFVGNIIGVSTKKQVIRINTRWIIASVANYHLSRNSPFVEFVANAMRYVVLIAIAHVSVPVKSFCLPLPAFTGLPLGDMFPEGFFKSYFKSLVLVAINEVMLLTWVTVTRNLLTATTFAKDRFRGMIIHVNSLLSAIGHSVGLVAQSPRFFIDSQVYYTTNTPVLKN